MLNAFENLHYFSAITCELIFGAHNIRLFEESQHKVDVFKRGNEIVVHPSWNTNNVTAGYDIAVINLPAPVPLTAYIQPIAIPARSDDDKDWSASNGTASGWGLMGDSESAISPVLNWVQVEIKNNAACNAWWLGTIKDTMLCGDGANGT